MDWKGIKNASDGVPYVPVEEANAAVQAAVTQATPWFSEIPTWALGLGGLALIGFLLVGFAVLMAMFFRIVVSTNEVHIVQSGKRTVSYGKDQPAGNTYYKWPAWVPVIGVKTSILPMSVFDVNLDGYAAYDKGRVPFNIDVMAFFRIGDSNMAAQRVHEFGELTDQLKGILQGAIRSILAKVDIEEILEKRSEFGEKFTDAVKEQLLAWGVVNVKNVELMDIRDSENSKVIANIMAKKQSLIERESRIEVAENNRAAREKEIETKRQVDLSAQQAEQAVGERTAEKERLVGIAQQKSQQAVQEEAALTATKYMAVRQVELVRAAEIERDVKVTAADQEKKQTVIVAEGRLEQAKLNAAGIEVEGNAKGAAETAILMAPVATQITLAKEIGQNPGYQQYLVSIRTVEKEQAVGTAQADALKVAEIKVIANSGDVVSGTNSVMGLFNSKGGTDLSAMVEAFVQTDTGKAIVEKLVK